MQLQTDIVGNDLFAAAFLLPLALFAAVDGLFGLLQIGKSLCNLVLDPNQFNPQIGDRLFQPLAPFLHDFAIAWKGTLKFDGSLGRIDFADDFLIKQPDIRFQLVDQAFQIQRLAALFVQSPFLQTHQLIETAHAPISPASAALPGA
ncbi:MAG TPA: hypothetical protein VM639_23150 [Dongiaceae bacterium]|nr:hypothetical protein [Dongiaceae bacterium]